MMISPLPGIYITRGSIQTVLTLHTFTFTWRLEALLLHLHSRVNVVDDYISVTWQLLLQGVQLSSADEETYQQEKVRDQEDSQCRWRAVRPPWTC